MADAPRKITIKLRPVGAKAAPAAATPAAAAAPTPPPAAPVAAPEVAPAAPAAAPEVAAKVETPAAAPAPTPDMVEIPPEEMAQQAKRQTSRIELPPEMVNQPMNAEPEAPTIKLKPISANAHEAPENPQAAKSKTARIELDAVLGGIQTNTPLANTTQKTIKLKRATPTTTAKATTSAPIAPVADKPAGGTEAPTLKLQRPILKKDAPKPAAAEPELEQLEPLEDLDLSPLPEVASAPVVESTGAKAFTIVAIVAAVAASIAAAIVCGIIQKHAASPDGSPATGNTIHSLPFERLF